MKPTSRVSGTMLPLRRSDVDTDQIIPSDWLKKVERTGFGEGLFSEWREDPAFRELLERHAGARVLVAGPNFGTGSSREHAVWAIQDYGFEAVVSPKFADIFRNNAVKCGLVPVELPTEAVERLWQEAEHNPTTEVSIDVEEGVVSLPDGWSCRFDLDEGTRRRLVEGLDDIALTLLHEAEISDHERRRPAWMPRVIPVT
ncbi:MAG: 3-isopropylmalate dehydratase small subunit [Acidimicrobiales bacterium]|nr:MAG: 3-isopropylmalate dehydratase small subunit [Acidimicrobiales bacterium]